METTTSTADKAKLVAALGLVGCGIAAYYWLARAQDGMEATAAARKTWNQFLAIRGNSPDDPFAADAKRRLAAASR